MRLSPLSPLPSSKHTHKKDLEGCLFFLGVLLAVQALDAAGLLSTLATVRLCARGSKQCAGALLNNLKHTTPPNNNKRIEQKNQLK